MPTEDCAQCNKIRALPDSPTRRDMTLDHLLDLGHQSQTSAATWTCEACHAIHTDATKNDVKLLAAINHIAQHLGHQARPVEAPNHEKCFTHSPTLDAPLVEPAKPPESKCWCGNVEGSPIHDMQAMVQPGSPHPFKPKPPESEAHECYGVHCIDIEHDLEKIRYKTKQDAQRLKEVEQQRDVAERQLIIATERAEKAERERDEADRCGSATSAELEWALAELAAVKGRLAKLVEAARIIARLYNLPGLLNACAEAEAGEHVHAWRPRPVGEWVCERCGNHRTTDPWLSNQKLEEVIADRAKWIKVCAERDNRIVELCNLMRRIKDYAGQHTQYPFANAIIDLCNQVLEPR